MIKGKRTVEVESLTTPGIRYEIDLDRRTCNCPAYSKHPSQPCKHLRSINGLFADSPSPDPIEALSAFIKAIRLRRAEDAVMWLLYLWRVPQYRARLQRRIFIAAGEDNLSVGVMEAVAHWFNTPSRGSLEDAVTETARICETPNWWGQKDGRAYIYDWLEAEGSAGAFEAETQEELFDLFLESTLHGDRPQALMTFTAIHARAHINPAKMGAFLSEIGRRTKSGQAKRLVRVYCSNIRALGADANISGQAVYAALVGSFGDQAVPHPEASYTRRLVKQAKERLSENCRIPDWALDGKHTGRCRDARFAGTCRMMAACCRAYEYYGRLSIEDRWLPSFLSPR